MKEYIKKQFFSFIKITIILVIVFNLNSSIFDNSSLTTAYNSNLSKNVSKDVIQNSQKELYKEGLYNPLYTFKGELTGYAGDCPLCSGYLACPPRTNVLKEGIYYDDKTYGNIRIVASSKNYPCGTILEFNVNKLSSEPIIAIVLDRGVGGNVIDLLTESEDYAIKHVGRVRELEFKVLREGWK